MGVMLVAAAALIGLVWNDPTFTPPGETTPQLVVAHHFKDWLSYKLGFDHHYGLDALDLEIGPFRGEAKLHWYALIPAIPMLLLALWLLVVALGRPAVSTGPQPSEDDSSAP